MYGLITIFLIISIVDVLYVYKSKNNRKKKFWFLSKFYFSFQNLIE